MNHQELPDTTILIVDDNPENLRVLFTYLTEAGFKVLAKRDSENVVELAVKKHPNLILLDILMPRIDGFEVCRQLKQHEATQDIPVIFISALTDIDDKLKGFELGGLDYITKPFQHAEVLARVNAHLTIQRLQRQLHNKNRVLETLLGELQTSNQKLEEANKKLEEVSLTDPLTGMRNRRYLTKVLGHDVAKVHRDYYERTVRGQQSANTDIVFFLLDLDRFKLVNDTYGHEAGDRVLSQLREIFEQICRAMDLMIRWGGEEFLLVIRDFNQQQAPRIAERLRSAFEAHAFELDNGQTIHQTCSIGVASYPFMPTSPEAVTWEQVIAIADKALYAAKRAGRNAYVQIVSTPCTLSQQLFLRIGEDIESMIASGELQVVTSISDPAQLEFH